MRGVSFVGSVFLTTLLGVFGCAQGQTGLGGAGGGGGESPTTTSSSSSTTTSSSTTSSSSSSTTSSSSSSSSTTSSSSSSTTSSSSSSGTVTMDGDTCANAIMLPGPGQYTHDQGFAADYTSYEGACDFATADGPDKVFSIEVPANAVLDVTMTPSGLFGDAVLVVASTCGDPIASCAGTADEGYEGDPETISYTNTSGAAQTVYIIADYYDIFGASPFTLDVNVHVPMCGDGIVEGAEACDDMNATASDGCTACQIDPGYKCTGAPSTCAPIPLGDACGNAVALPGSGMYMYDASSSADDYTDYLGACSSIGKTADGADMVFSIELEAGAILDVTMTPAGADDAVLLLASSCGSPVASCVDYRDDNGSGTAETLSYTNTTATKQTMFIIADTYYTGDGGPFALSVNVHVPMCGDGVVESNEACDDGNMVASDGCTGCQIDPGYGCTGAPSTCTLLPAGDACSKAIPITASATIQGTFSGFSNQYDPTSTGCTTYTEKGPDIAYSIALMAGQKLSATLTPGAQEDVALYVVTDCAQLSSCVAASDSGFDGDPESLMYTATAAQTVYLIVDSYEPTTSGPYSLNVTLQ